MVVVRGRARIGNLASKRYPHAGAYMRTVRITMRTILSENMLKERCRTRIAKEEHGISKCSQRMFRSGRHFIMVKLAPICKSSNQFNLGRWILRIRRNSSIVTLRVKAGLSNYQ